MFSATESQKSSFLEQTKAAREERALEKKREGAAIRIQSSVKGFLARRRFQKRIVYVYLRHKILGTRNLTLLFSCFREDFDALLLCGVNEDQKEKIDLHTSSTVYPVFLRFLTHYKLSKDCEETRERFECLCRYLNKAMESESPKLSYATLCLQKEKR